MEAFYPLTDEELLTFDFIKIRVEEIREQPLYGKEALSSLSKAFLYFLPIEKLHILPQLAVGGGCHLRDSSIWTPRYMADSLISICWPFIVMALGLFLLLVQLLQVIRGHFPVLSGVLQWGRGELPDY